MFFILTSFFTQTEYSFLDNTCKINDLVKKASEYGYEYLSIADNDNLHGSLKFYNECEKYGISPIIGINLTIESKS